MIFELNLGLVDNVRNLMVEEGNKSYWVLNLILVFLIAFEHLLTLLLKCLKGKEIFTYLFRPLISSSNLNTIKIFYELTFRGIHMKQVEDHTFGVERSLGSC